MIITEMKKLDGIIVKDMDDLDNHPDYLNCYYCKKEGVHNHAYMFTVNFQDNTKHVFIPVCIVHAQETIDMLCQVTEGLQTKSVPNNVKFVQFGAKKKVN